MDNEKVRLRMRYSSKLTAIRELNESFDIGRMLIAYSGKNRNGSDISMAAFEKAKPTIYNCPVVCNYDAESDTIGGHDSAIVRTDNGGIRLVNMTVPIGVVPESSEVCWESVIEDDGAEREYLAADVLLWKRQSAYSKIKADGICGQSMEITVRDGHKDEDGYFSVDDFEFNAFCLLGEDVEPCFESASLELYSCDNFGQQMAQMMQDFKKSFAYISSAAAGEDIKNNSNEEGGNDLDEKIALVEGYGMKVEDLDFSIDDMSIEDLRAKFEAASKPEVEETEEPIEEEHKEFRLEGEKREELISALESAVVDTPWGEMPRYWFFDYDNELMEIYATDSEDWKIYGFSFSADGDTFVIDFESKKRMRITLVDFDEGEQPSPFAAAFAKMSADYSALSEQFRSASSTIEEQNSELAVLRKFKKDTDEAAAKAERDAVFEEFADLNGNEAFETLRENCGDLGRDAIEEKCYAIRGRAGTAAKFSYEQKRPKIIVGVEDHSDEPYGGLFTQYGHRS